MKWNIEFINDWSKLFDKNNRWFGVLLSQFYVGFGKDGEFEVEIVALGLGFSIDRYKDYSNI